jgi:hypothetical protein
MESHGSGSKVAGWARLVGWAVGLGLLTGQLAYQTNGRGAGLMVTAACAILMWRIIVTIGPLVPRREDSAGSTDTATLGAALDDERLPGAAQLEHR